MLVPLLFWRKILKVYQDRRLKAASRSVRE